jgi:hypothetical protein
MSIHPMGLAMNHLSELLDNNELFFEIIEGNMCKVICKQCARDLLLGKSMHCDVELNGYSINFEDPNLYCAWCNSQIEPVYSR